MDIANNTRYTELTFNAMQKRVQTSNEKDFNKDRVIRTATKRTEARG